MTQSTSGMPPRRARVSWNKADLFIRKRKRYFFDL
jgi:hypothetical protein